MVVLKLPWAAAPVSMDMPEAAWPTPVTPVWPCDIAAAQFCTRVDPSSDRDGSRCSNCESAAAKDGGMQRAGASLCAHTPLNRRAGPFAAARLKTGLAFHTIDSRSQESLSLHSPPWRCGCAGGCSARRRAGRVPVRPAAVPQLHRPHPHRTILYISRSNSVS